MGRIEGQIKKQQRDRMFQEKIEQTLDETDLFEQEKKEIMDELVNERKEEPEEHVDSHYDHPPTPKEECRVYIPPPVFNGTIGDITYSNGTQQHKYATPVENHGVGGTTFGVSAGYYNPAESYHPAYNPALNMEQQRRMIEELEKDMEYSKSVEASKPLQPCHTRYKDVSFAAHVKARQEAILQQAMEDDMMYEKSNAEPKILQPRHTRYNDANTIFVYGCSDCPFMRKKAFENKILVTCHFNPEQEFIFEQGYSADELDNLMRNNCQLRKLIEINIRLT